MSSANEEHRSDVFPPNQTPIKMTKAQFIDVLNWLLCAIENDDSMEGSLMYAWGSEPGMYDVGGVLRAGNRNGQGSVSVFWDMS